MAFRPGRLLLHELLIRVTADISVPDGSKIEDLGINFRRIVNTILTRYIAPEQHVIEANYESLRRDLAVIIATELEILYPAPRKVAAPPRSAVSRLRTLFQRSRASETTTDAGAEAESAVIAAWEATARSGHDPVRAAACRALARVASALVARHGQVWGDRDTIAAVALDLACNAHGSDVIGRLVDPLLKTAAAMEPYALLPPQEHPVVMNTKGASASGKSTLRPRQRQLARDIGVRWSEFALISPDIWRKQLLDYGTLGPAYKYGGAFTGEELQIVDKKLDRYMAMKAERGEMTHLLIDRFRFDSFAPDSDEAGSNLLTRFGHDVYLFFMITPPEALVERAWKRGLELGRYKAVDDTLAHGIDAYAGMPHLIFTWAKRSDKRVQFELLDNSVAAGERPRTVAFGSNRVLNVLDVKSMLDIERFRRVNVDATSPDTLYADCRPPAAGAQRGLFAAVPRVFSRGQFRGSIHWTDLPRVCVGRAGLVRSRCARRRHRQRGDPCRPRRRRAFRAGPHHTVYGWTPLPRFRVRRSTMGYRGRVGLVRERAMSAAGPPQGARLRSVSEGRREAPRVHSSADGTPRGPIIESLERVATGGATRRRKEE